MSYLSPAKNQNFPYACNSGWAFSTIGMLEARIKNIRKGATPDISLSTQVLLSCDTLDFGCLGVKFFLITGLTNQRLEVHCQKQYHWLNLPFLHCKRVHWRLKVHIVSQMPKMHFKRYLQKRSQLQNLWNSKIRFSRHRTIHDGLNSKKWTNFMRHFSHQWIQSLHKLIRYLWRQNRR